MRRPRAAVPGLLAAALLGAPAGGCDRVPGRPTPAEAEIRPDRVVSFEVLYGQNCAGCHGPGGKGGAALALANPVYLAIVDDASLRRAAAEGVAGTMMPAFAQGSGGMLTDAQIEILVRGVRGWGKPDALAAEAPPPYAGPGGDASRGAAVYGAFCASCHGAGGAGGPKAGSIVDGSFLGLVSNQSLRTTVIAGRPEIGQPDWRRDGERPLTPAEVSDVVAWLAAQRPAMPGRPYPGRNE